DFEHVPGNGLALAVGVGRQNELLGALDGLGDLREALGCLGIDLPDHPEIVFGVDRAVLGRQVAHVAERGQHLVAGAKIFVDGLAVGRCLDNENVTEGPICCGPGRYYDAPPATGLAGRWVTHSRLSNRYRRPQANPLAEFCLLSGGYGQIRAGPGAGLAGRRASASRKGGSARPRSAATRLWGCEPGQVAAVDADPFRWGPAPPAQPR